MSGLGTLINAGAIIAGGLLGYLFQWILIPRIQQTVLQAIGLAVIFIGVSRTLAYMLKINHQQLATQGSIMVTISLALGAAIGEALNIEAWFEKFGRWLQKISHNEGDSRFIEGFITATLTTCVGAMGIIGCFQDGINHEYTTLMAKAVIDGVFIAIMAAGFGVGPIFSAIPLFIYQEAVTYLAVLIKPLLSTAMINGISLVGSMLIACIGLNIMFNLKIKVGNFLPALLIVVFYIAIWGF